MKTAQNHLILSLTTIMVAAALALPSRVWAAAGSLQNCEPGGTCLVGEFLYNDSYVPITNATCTLTSKYPDGSDFHTNQQMTAASDGYYSYQFTAPSTTGVYRAQVCCTSGSDYLCLDKSFEVKTTSAASTGDIASAVWGYSSRNLTGFGNLISDIWGYSSRNLTSLITGTTNITNNITKIESTANETRKLLEQLVNKPIIETTLEEEEDLGTKLKETKAIANALYVNSQYISTRSRSLSTKGNLLTTREINKTLDEISSLLGTKSDSKSESTIFAGMNWLNSAWDFSVLADLYKNVDKMESIATSLKRKALLANSVFSQTEIRNLAIETARFEKGVGNVSDPTSAGTLFAKIKEVEELAVALDTKTQDIDKTLASWNSLAAIEKQNRAKGFLKTVLTLNNLPKIKNVIAVKLGVESDDKALKNRLLSMKGVLAANKIYLAKSAGKTVLTTWLEEGSIIFKTLVTNPSTLIAQSVDVKYYLPKEVKEENIIEKDEGLEIKYDSEKDQYYVFGKVELAVGESKTLEVKVNDIWQLGDETIESKKKAAAELFRALERTSFFAQGVTLKSDIDVSLDKAKALRDSAFTPEEKIRAYREAQLEMVAVDEKLDKLQDLVTQAGSAGTLFGFVGGAQALAVWGLIVILVAGFVFLAIYMRVLGGETKKPKKETKNRKKNEFEDLITPRVSGRPRLSLHPIIILAITALSSAAISAGVTTMLMTRSASSRQASTANQEPVLAESAVAPDPSPSPRPESEETAVGGEDTVLVEVPEGLSVNVREAPSLTARVLIKISLSRSVTRIGTEGEWVNIVYDIKGDGNLSSDIEKTAINGWVHEKFIKEPEENSTEEGLSLQKNLESIGVATIKETPTGWLRVRTKPWGIEIARVNPGESYPALDRQTGWYLIEIAGGEPGWVSAEYVTIED